MVLSATGSVVVSERPRADQVNNTNTHAARRAHARARTKGEASGLSARVISCQLACMDRLTERQAAGPWAA
jgi:hypothetical protein